MGCTSSREARCDRRSPAPYARSQSMPRPHAGISAAAAYSRKVGDSNRRRRRHHVVALTSSTLDSLHLDTGHHHRHNTVSSNDDEAMMKVTKDAKSWSEMIEVRIPKTSPRTPTTEPETINAWELMAGLEEATAVDHHRSFSFNNAGDSPPRPLWMQTAPDEGSIVSNFDPHILSNFRQALAELSPQRQSLLRSPEPARNSNVAVLYSKLECETPKLDKEEEEEHLFVQRQDTKFTGIVKTRTTAFQQKIDAKRGKRCPPNGDGKVVFYFTSLRGIRKTYEECWAVKVILDGYGVRVDERDVSMHAGFKEELSEILGDGFGGGWLPRVFANGNYLGGAEEVRQMHEAGELGRALEECDAALVGKGGAGVCEGCAGVRFVPCETCSGSCKVFVEEEEGEEGEVVGGGFRRCPDCNENGLVRCQYCL